MSITGKIVGYDPGGNDAHGVASLVVSGGDPKALTFTTVRNAEAALKWFKKGGMPLAAGIDTLTQLSTGDSGWRPADRWLRSRYPEVQKSVDNPNHLHGSMTVNGLAVVLSLRDACEDILISETHPKVLFYHLNERRYDYRMNRIAMNRQLSEWIQLTAETTSDHEWDAVASCFAVLEGVTGRWPGDLHRLPAVTGESLIRPGGPSHYYWPIEPTQ